MGLQRPVHDHFEKRRRKRFEGSFGSRGAVPGPLATMKLMSRRISIVASFALLCCAMLTGCGQSVAEFHLDMIEMKKDKVSPQQQQQIADILTAMFGTPDEPFVLPQTGSGPRENHAGLRAGESRGDQRAARLVPRALHALPRHHRRRRRTDGRVSESLSARLPPRLVQIQIDAARRPADDGQSAADRDRRNPGHGDAVVQALSAGGSRSAGRVCEVSEHARPDGVGLGRVCGEQSHEGNRSGSERSCVFASEAQLDRRRNGRSRCRLRSSIGRTT